MDKPKHGCLIKILAGIGIFFVLLRVLGIIRMMFGGGDKDKEESNSQENVSVQEESTEPSTETVTPAESAQETAPETASTPAVYDIGQTADVDGVSVTLNSARVSTTVDTNMGASVTADPGNVYLITDWSIPNNSDSNITTGPSSFKTYVDNNAVDVGSATFMIPNALPSTASLEPGRQTAGTVVYQLPEAWQTFDASYQPNPFIDNSAKFQLVN